MAVFITLPNAKAKAIGVILSDRYLEVQLLLCNKCTNGFSVPPGDFVKLIVS